jgi:hypothetical protein
MLLVCQRHQIPDSPNPVRDPGHLREPDITPVVSGPVAARGLLLTALLCDHQAEGRPP